MYKYHHQKILNKFFFCDNKIPIIQQTTIWQNIPGPGTADGVEQKTINDIERDGCEIDLYVNNTDVKRYSPHPQQKGI